MYAQLLSHVQLFATLQAVASRLLCPWDSPGKNTGVGCHFLLQGIFPNKELNPCLLCLLHWQADSLPLSHLGSLPIWLACYILKNHLIQRKAKFLCSLNYLKFCFYFVLIYFFSFIFFYFFYCSGFCHTLK